MSEFARTLQVRVSGAVTAAAVVAAAERAKATALVLPEAGAWVAVVVASAHVGRLLAELDLAVDYRFAADHGASATLYLRGRRLGRIRRDFEAQDHETDARAFAEHGLLDADAIARIERGPAAADRAAIATALGLTNVSWISPEDLASTERRRALELEFPDAVFLEDGRRCSWGEPGPRVSVVLCTLSAKRLATLRAEPDLAEQLLDVEEPVPGLLDLDTRATVAARRAGLERAVLGSGGETLLDQVELTVRILSPRDVARIAEILPAGGPRSVRDLYHQAASGAEGMLVMIRHDV